MGKMKLRENTLTVNTGLFRSARLPLDALRLVTLIIPGTFSWRVIQSSQQKGFYNLDLMEEDVFRGLLKELSGLVENTKAGRLGSMKFCLADYDGNWAVFSLGDVKRSQVPFLEALGLCRPKRIEKLKAWLDGRPAVTLKGGFGSRAFLNREGFRRGEKKFIAWSDVEKIQTESVNFSHSLLALPKGRGGGMFSLKRYEYSVRNFPERKKELYIAECSFWRALPQ